MSNAPKHILIIRLSAIGDVAMCVPVIRAFTKQHPGIKITILSKAFLKPLFNNIPNVNFYVVDVKSRHKGLYGLYRLSREIKGLKFDAIGDMHNVLRSKIIRFYLSTSSIKTAVIDKGRVEKKALTRVENKIFRQLKTSHERYADVFREIGFTIDLSQPEFPSKAKMSSEITKILLPDQKKWIGIAPFAQYQSKMYPLDLMEGVISSLVAKGKYTLLLFGGGTKEVQDLEQLANKFQNTISVAGKLSFNNELDLISNLDCMVSMDSANSHLAAMHGVKTITLWGITHPYAGFAPFNQPADYQILPDRKKYPHLPCSIYGNKICDGYEQVMRSISPEAVIEKITDILLK